MVEFEEMMTKVRCKESIDRKTFLRLHWSILTDKGSVFGKIQ